MSLNDIPSGERKHIAFFGCRNAGKSSLVNAFTGQKLSIVSDTKGTTTDPVSKSMELLPLGPVVIIDTPGIDDVGTLGELRVEKTKQVLNKTDIAILVVDSSIGISSVDKELIDIYKEKKIPYIIAYNKVDIIQGKDSLSAKNVDTNKESVNITQASDIENIIYVSATSGTNIDTLKETAARLIKESPQENELIGDLIQPGDKIVLVIPIDKAAPKGRLILPQQQVIRDALDHGAIPIMCRDSELEETLFSLKEDPRMVITDSQAFGKVSKLVPKRIPLTSFSILMARYKGNLNPSVIGASKIKSIQNGDKILISEGCTHHRQCGDIGSIKLPKWIKDFTGCEPEIHLSSGTEFPEDLSDYKLIIHCGACMLTPTEAKSRYERAGVQNVPITNYGTAIAYMNGILKRSLEIFPDLAELI